MLQPMTHATAGRPLCWTEQVQAVHWTVPAPLSFSSAVSTPLGMSCCLIGCRLSSTILASGRGAFLAELLLPFKLLLTSSSCFCTMTARDSSSSAAVSLISTAASALKLLRWQQESQVYLLLVQGQDLTSKGRAEHHLSILPCASIRLCRASSEAEGRDLFLVWTDAAIP